MPNKILNPTESTSLFRLIRLIAIVLLSGAICFRFTHLDRKLYWHDEAYTSSVITARPGKYLTDDLFQTKVVKPDEVLAYQRFVPSLTLTDMIVRKGTEDVQHPPLYYVLLRFWAQLWGTTPTVTRGFSALLSLLVFPAVYWLCLELFESTLSGWVAIALFAVSPFHLVFAQEARQFGVWVALILASSALLLRSLRTSSWRSWVWYGVAMILSFYTSLFSVFVAIGHFVYVLGVDPDNRLLKLPVQIGERTVFCFLSLVATGLVFIPWIYFIVSSDSLRATTGWTATPLPLLIYIQATIFNFSYSFIDFNANFSNAYVLALASLLVVLQGYAVYVICQTAPRKVWFILTFVGSTALLLLLPDLLFGGQRFAITRYPIVCYVGLHLAVVYLVSNYLTATQRWKSRLATLIFVTMIGLGIFSCGVYSQANTWWNKVVNSNYHQLAEVINRSDRPLIIADVFSHYAYSLVSLSYLLQPDTQLLLLPSVGESFPIKELPEDVKTIFLFNLPGVFRQQFESRYKQKLTLVFQDTWNEVWHHQANDSDQKRSSQIINEWVRPS